MLTWLKKKNNLQSEVGNHNYNRNKPALAIRKLKEKNNVIANWSMSFSTFEKHNTASFRILPQQVDIEKLNETLWGIKIVGKTSDFIYNYCFETFKKYNNFAW